MENAENILKDCSCELKVPEDKIIKMCPFCGGEAKFHDRYKYSIVCTNHDCIIASPAMIYKSKELAIEAWNKRIVMDGD